MKLRIVPALLFLVIVTLLTGCDYYDGYQIEDTRPRGNTVGNINNGGIAAMCDERIYFANLHNGLRLYSMKHDGGDMRRLNDAPTNHINVINGMIFYNLVPLAHMFGIEGAQFEDEGRIFAMQTDGEGYPQKLNADDLMGRNTSSLIVVGDKIFYNRNGTGRGGDEGSGLYVMQIDGSNRRKLSSQSAWESSINVIGDYVYFLRGLGGLDLNYGNLFRINVDGSNEQSLGDGRFLSIIVHGDKIFATSERCRDYGVTWIYSMNRNGGDLQRLSEHPATALNMSNEYIFFIGDDGSLESSRNLYRMNLDGSNKQMLSSCVVLFYAVLGYEIFFFAIEYIGLTADEAMLFRMNFDGSNKRRVV